jgi:hypothetical protein
MDLDLFKMGRGVLTSHLKDVSFPDFMLSHKINEKT